MPSFRDLLDAADAYSERFKTATPYRSMRTDLIPSLGYEEGTMPADVDSEDYLKLILACDRYVRDPDDEAVYLVK